jgi:hypothetical protein
MVHGAQAFSFLFSSSSLFSLSCCCFLMAPHVLSSLLSPSAHSPLPSSPSPSPFLCSGKAFLLAAVEEHLYRNISTSLLIFENS